MKNFFIVAFMAVFGCGCDTQHEQIDARAPRVDETYAMKSVQAIVGFGDRSPDSSGSTQTVEYLKAKSLMYCDSADIHEFTASTPHGSKTFRNVVAEIKGQRDEYIIVGSHFDTKIIPGIPIFTGANDGGSSTGVLLAMMKAVKESAVTPLFTLRFAFFDGEECYHEYGEHDGLFGSKEYASRLEASGELKKCRAFVLLDMIGDTSLKLTIPANTDPELFQLLKDAAEVCAVPQIVTRFPMNMLDDFIPFQEKGVPCIDLIDFEYGPGNVYWHTSHDTIDKISSSSLKTSGDLALQLIWMIR